MLDDAAKVARWSEVRESLVAEEVQRLEQFVRLVIETTPYGEKEVTYTPRIGRISTAGLLDEFVARCRQRQIDVARVGGSDCLIRIHAPCPKPRGTA
jgi:hypothetical protein